MLLVVRDPRDVAVSYSAKQINKTTDEVIDLMNQTDGVEVIDGVELGSYPTAVSEASGADPVYVGRIREDISHPNGINLWIVADNIRKGAALNTVQIAEILVRDYL